MTITYFVIMSLLLTYQTTVAVMTVMTAAPMSRISSTVANNNYIKNKINEPQLSQLVQSSMAIFKRPNKVA